MIAWITRKTSGVGLFEDTPAPRLTSSKLTLGLVLLRLFVSTVYMTCYYIHRYMQHAVQQQIELLCASQRLGECLRYRSALGSLMPIEFRP